MRIAMVAPPWYSVPPRAYGGIEQVVALLVDGLVDRGHDVLLVTVGQHGTRAQTVLTSYDEPPSRRIGEALPEVVHAAFTRAVLADAAVDLVHDHTTAGPLVATTRGVPTVVTAHNDVGVEHGRVLRSLGDDVHVVALSAAQQRQAPDLNWLGIAHNGIDVGRWAYRPDKQDFLLFLGRASPEKAPHVAIDVARAAGRRIVLAAKCVEPGEREYYAEHVAPRLGPDVEWLGEISEQRKATLLATAAGLLFPITWEEPFGLVLLEAMVCGTPVVALRRGAVEEVVDHGVSGFVCDTPAEMVDAVGRLERLDPARCRRHVADRFGAGRMVERYEQLYTQLLRPRDVTARAAS